MTEQLHLKSRHRAALLALLREHLENLKAWQMAQEGVYEEKETNEIRKYLEKVLDEFEA